MSKRRLTQRQLTRIRKQQHQRLLHDNSADSELYGPQLDGTVVSHLGQQIEVETLSKPKTRQRCFYRSALNKLAVGDRVIWRQGKKDVGLVEAVQNRASELCRPDPYGDKKTIAANVDLIAIVVASRPKPKLQLIDRYLVACETQAIKTILVLNKMDQISHQGALEIETIQRLYTPLGYKIFSTSAINHSGMDQLESFLSQHTSVFVGQSGVGKSSLTNALIPEASVGVGELSAGHETGSHTTSASSLFHLPEGGQIIDSPGLREFGLWDLSKQSILEGFVELRPYIGHCKFRNCEHDKEPNCAILAACEAGHISPERMESFLALRTEAS